MEVKLQKSLSLALDGGQQSASCFSHFISSTQWIRGWMGPTVCLDVMEKRRIPAPARTKLCHPACSHSLY